MIIEWNGLARESDGKNEEDLWCLVKGGAASI